MPGEILPEEGAFHPANAGRPPDLRLDRHLVESEFQEPVADLARGLVERARRRPRLVGEGHSHRPRQSRGKPEDPPLRRGRGLPVEERDLVECGQRGGRRLEPSGDPEREAGRVLGAELAEDRPVADEDGPLRRGYRIGRCGIAELTLVRGPIGEPLPELASVAGPVDHRGDRPDLARLACLPDRLGEDRPRGAGRQADPASVELATDRPPEVGPAPDPRTRIEAGIGAFRSDRHLSPDLVAGERRGGKPQALRIGRGAGHRVIAQVGTVRPGPEQSLARHRRPLSVVSATVGRIGFRTSRGPRSPIPPSIQKNTRHVRNGQS